LAQGLEEESSSTYPESHPSALSLSKRHQRDGTKITDFKRCDFRPMYEYFETERAKKKALSSAEKKELKKEKDEAEAKYTHCNLDGRKEKVGNFRIEPPGLFRGRGEHPKKGALKVITTSSSPRRTSRCSPQAPP
jgi:DNA topoisomerase IB